MNIHPRLHRSSVASLAILAILTFLSLASQTSAQVSALAPDLLTKLLDLVANKGSAVEVPAAVGNALGLSAKGQRWPSRQISSPDRNSGFHHLFGVGTGTRQDVIFVLRYPDNKLLVIPSHRNGNAAAALIYDTTTRQITMLTSAEGRKSLDAKITWWTTAFQNPK
jgi:hypothetical protein